ncbi:hypothetical protein fugu_016428 [Takifugu bimaculatus]|uniref:Solute carrier family 25 member 29 n=1 Tax=Takifugu bimaculatus TaxID=433685 RepID=A0A4Z2BSY0_9TELE|nr:hypothetical protein fugu_016428 [Takifugu bimaculatus]
MDFVAGCMGGAAGVLVGHPFDTVKVRLQVQNVDRPLYRGTFHCFQSIVRQESMLGLYKGIGSPMMGLTFINAIVFGVQGNAMRRLGCDTPLNQFLAGASAGAIQCCHLLPDGARQDTHAAPGDRIYRKEGFRGINRGMVTTLMRETPGFGVYFLAYDLLTRSLGCEPEDPYMIPKLLFAGGMSGIASWISTYPVDVIKSRLQADGVGGVNRYSGIMDCVRQSLRKEGWRVFSRGLVSTLLRAFPVNAATFATVTLFLLYMREGQECSIPNSELQPAQLQPAAAAASAAAFGEHAGHRAAMRPRAPHSCPH